MKRTLLALVAALLLGGLAATPIAQARIWRASGMLDWFVAHFTRIQSLLGLDRAQRAQFKLAKKPLGDALKEAAEVEKARLVRLRATFLKPDFTEEEFHKLVAARRATQGESERQIRAAAVKTLVAVHKLLRPEQRERLLEEFAKIVERRHFQYQRPMH